MHMSECELRRKRIEDVQEEIRHVGYDTAKSKSDCYHFYRWLPQQGMKYIYRAYHNNIWRAVATLVGCSASIGMHA